MRTFVLFTRQARTDSSFNIEDLPSSGGRMDLVARCISSALWLSHGLRDADIYCVLNGPPRPPVTVRFVASELRKVSPDERSIALWLKKVLSAEVGKEWAAAKPGMYVAARSFQEVIAELEGRPLYVLHEKGEPITGVKLGENPVFVLGDHEGIPKNDESFALRHGGQVSLGKQSYLASSCISVLNWLCDNV